MNKLGTIIGAGALTLLLAACDGSAVAIPDPTVQDYANQNILTLNHPGMDCVMEWVGTYITTCYPMTIHPPYSVRVYFPDGCTCPSVQPRPANYSTPKPVFAGSGNTPQNNVFPTYTFKQNPTLRYTLPASTPTRTK